MIAALLAATLLAIEPVESGSPPVSSTPEMQAILADPTRDPPLRPEMVSVMTACGVERSQVFFSRGPEAFGFVIRLTVAQSASRRVKNCLDTEIDHRHLRDVLWYVPPMPPAGHRVH